ncbi:MAG: hypothetical protein JXB14_02705, partial [Candidatus Altiarchaeota archaeon]|nr:hypothetical protein [Candidatus Altiarchaeota archaeon]
EDWTWFKDTERTKRIIEFVNKEILDAIQKVMEGARHESKKMVLFEHKEELKKLNSISRTQIGSFIDKIQMNCPRMTQQDLSRTVDILIKMDLSRTGYGLLQQLVTLSPRDIDELHDILDKWSVTDAHKVLNELQWRLDVIEKIEELVENPETKELQDLQPLFEQGLWIFGPEYEAIEYQSNKSLSTIIKRLFQGDGTEVKHPLKRPDFVVLPDSSIAVYSADEYNDGEVCGVRKVLILELKRGGFTIGHDEKRQALDYAIAIRDSGRVSGKTDIICFVLAANIDNSAMGEMTERQISVTPKTFSIVLKQAHARTFNLIEKIKKAKDIPDSELSDSDISEVLSQCGLDDFK